MESLDSGASKRLHRAVPFLVALATLFIAPPQAQARRSGPKVMVLDLTHDESVKPATMTALNSFLSGEVRDQGFAVITPSQIGAVLGLERQKQLLGCSESNCLAEIGGALGVDYIVQGSLAVLSHQSVLTLTLIDQRGASMASQRKLVQGVEVDGLFPAMHEMVPKLMSAVRPKANLNPAEVPASSTPVADLGAPQVQASATHHATGSYVFLATGAALLAGSLVTGLLAKHSEGAYQADIRDGRAGSLASDKDATQRWALISTVALGAGLLSAGGGGIWWLTSGHAETTP